MSCDWCTHTTTLLHLTNLPAVTRKTSSKFHKKYKNKNKKKKEVEEERGYGEEEQNPKAICLKKKGGEWAL